MKLIITLFLLCSLNLQGQNIFDYYYQIYQADRLAEEGKIDSAILHCEMTFKQQDYTQPFLIYKVLRWSKRINDKDRVKHYKQVYKDIAKLPPENKRLLHIVDSILEVDQKTISSKTVKAWNLYKNCLARGTCDTTSRKFRKAKLLSEKVKDINSANVDAILALIEKYGFMGDEMLGVKGSFHFLVPLLHFDSDSNSRVLEPILREALLKNQIAPIVYTTLIDRHNMHTTGRQKFWTSPYRNFGDCKPHLSAEEIEEVMKLRESVGIYGSRFWFEYQHGYWVLKNYFPLHN